VAAAAVAPSPASQENSAIKEPGASAKAPGSFLISTKHRTRLHGSGDLFRGGYLALSRLLRPVYGLMGSFDQLLKRSAPAQRATLRLWRDGDLSGLGSLLSTEQRASSIGSRVCSRASSVSLGLVTFLMLAVLMVLTACGSETVGAAMR
jgi:hypothetical protein